MATPKKRLVKDYDALPEDILHGVKTKYPTGYENYLVSYTDAKGAKVSALPFETDDAYYLIRMTVLDARRLVKEDEDFDDEGVLREGFSEPTVAENDEGEATDEDLEEFNDDGNDGEDDHIIVTRRGRDDDDEEIGGGISGGMDDY